MAEDEDDALRRIVREEAERMRIRTALVDEAAPKPAPAQKKSALRALAEHPVGRLIFGFILTGVIGQSLSWSYAERKEEQELRRSALEAVREFSTLEQRRRARYVATRSAILNGESFEVITDRKAAYDEAYVDWNAQLQAQRLQFREFFGFARRHPIESSIDVDFLPVWGKLHRCLTSSILYLRKDERAKALEVLQKCGLPATIAEDASQQGDGSSFLLSVAKNCAYELSSSLNQHIMNGFDCGRPFWRDDGVRMYAALSDICDPSRVRERRDDGNRVSSDPDAIWRYYTPRANAVRHWPYAITPAERKAASAGGDEEGGRDLATLAALDRSYDNLCVKDDPWYEFDASTLQTSDPAFSADP